MAHLAPQARWCSRACKQAGYRLRLAGLEDQEDNAPSAVYQAPEIARLEAVGQGWRVHFTDGQALDVAGPCGVGQARARARWATAGRCTDQAAALEHARKY